jgi:hypothetical protein
MSRFIIPKTSSAEPMVLNDLVIEQGNALLILRDDLWLEGAVTVAWHAESYQILQLPNFHLYLPSDIQAVF